MLNLFTVTLARPKISKIKVTVPDFGDQICVKVDDWVGATESIIKLKPKVVER